MFLLKALRADFVAAKWEINIWHLQHGTFDVRETEGEKTGEKGSLMHMGHHKTKPLAGKWSKGIMEFSGL